MNVSSKDYKARFLRLIATMTSGYPFLPIFCPTFADNHSKSVNVALITQNTLFDEEYGGLSSIVPLSYRISLDLRIISNPHETDAQILLHYAACESSSF